MGSLLLVSRFPTIAWSDTTSLSSVAVRGVHVFRANSLSRMFSVMACASHSRFPLLRLAKSLTGTCMFSMNWADTLAMSPYSSVVAHTYAAIPWAFRKPHGLLVGLALSSSSEPSLALSTDSPGLEHMGHPFLERCVANGKCAIAGGVVRPELGTCSAPSVGRVPHSLTLGKARGGAYKSWPQAAPTTWHMSAPQEMGCSTAARLHTRLLTASNNTACISNAQHLNIHMSAHKHTIERHTSPARHPRTSGPTQLAPVSRCTG